LCTSLQGYDFEDLLIFEDRPPELLSPQEKPLKLTPYLIRSTAEPIYALDIHPFHDLSNPSSTLYVSSTPSHPISLHRTLSTDLIGSFPLIHGPTEAYLSAYSLLFVPSTPSTFLAGTNSTLALFSLDRPYSTPILTIPTIPSTRNNLVGGGVGMKGIVSSLAISSSEILAAGTFTRCIGLYDHSGSGDSIAVFELPEGEDAGNGITSVKWDEAGRYLFVAERCSDVVLVYDVRVTGKQLGSLSGRKARTNQRLDIEVVEGTGTEVWAGGTDGVVRVWLGPWNEQPTEPSWNWSAGGIEDENVVEKVEPDPISSVGVHPSGTVLATCSGQRHLRDRFAENDSDSDETESRNSQSDDLSSKASEPAIYDNTLKIWSV
jgi:hypothetical protein